MSYCPRTPASLLALCLSLLLAPANLQAQTGSTATATATTPLAYPPALHEAQALQRTEGGLAARQQKHEDSTGKKIALVPVRIILIPLKILNYPLEKWFIRSTPPPYSLRALGIRRSLLKHGYTIRYGGFGVGRVRVVDSATAGCFPGPL